MNKQTIQMNIEIFYSACKKGCLKRVQQLYSDLHIYVYDYMEQSFTCACRFGHLDVAQWLLEVKPDIDVKYGYRYALGNGHLDVAQWISDVCPYINNNTEHHEQAFRYACYNNNIQAAQWILKVNPNINIYTHNDFAYKYAKSSLLKWIVSLNPFKYSDDHIVNNPHIEHMMLAMYVMNYHKYIVTATIAMTLSIYM